MVEGDILLHKELLDIYKQSGLAGVMKPQVWHPYTTRWSKDIPVAIKRFKG